MANTAFTNRIACAANLDFVGALPKESIQLIVTSPPYNIGKSYEKGRSLLLNDYVEQQKLIIDECFRVLKPGGSICWQVGNHISKEGEVFPLDIILYPLFTAHRALKLRNRVIWHFEHGLHCTSRLSGRHEVVLWFTKDAPSGTKYVFDLDPIRVPQKYPHKKHFKGPNQGKLSGNPRGKNPGDVWTIPNVKHNHVEKEEHPCQFPVELVERFVLATTKEGDAVLDPYLGSGSTAVAAVKNGRIALGCDIEQKYIDLSRSRLDRLAKGELRTRPMNRPVYAPPAKQPAPLRAARRNSHESR